MTLTGEAALKLLLNSQKFFEVLQHSIRSEGLAHLIRQIPPLISKLGVNENTLPVLIPVSQYTRSSHQQKTLPPKGASDGVSDGSSGGDGGEVSDCSISEGHSLLCGVINDVFSCCDLHVISSVCSLLHNLHLAFPDFMATQCHNKAVILQLTR